MSLRAVFFDFGGTLAWTPPSVSRPAVVWTATFERLGLPIVEVRFEEALSQVDQELGSLIYSFVGRMDEYWRLYDDCVMDHLRIRRRRDEIRAAVQQVFDDPSNVRLYPETRTVLTKLTAQGYRLGVISNHNDRLLSELKVHRIDRFFGSVTYSQEVGAEKPAREVFTRALERAGCAPGEAMHVGNSLSADVEGARRSGLQPVWVNRDDQARVAEVPTIRTLAELPPLLERLNRPRFQWGRLLFPRPPQTRSMENPRAPGL